MVGHLKDALFLTLDDVQLWVVDNLDGALDQLERLADVGRTAVRLLQESEVGRAATSGLDDVLSRLEDATAYYLPLPPTLREYGEFRVTVVKSSSPSVLQRQIRSSFIAVSCSCRLVM